MLASPELPVLSEERTRSFLDQCLGQAVRFHIQKLPYAGKRVEKHPPHQTRQLPESEVGKRSRKEKVGSQGVGGTRNQGAL